jgi:hypothetical protein
MSAAERPPLPFGALYRLLALFVVVFCGVHALALPRLFGAFQVPPTPGAWVAAMTYQLALAVALSVALALPAMLFGRLLRPAWALGWVALGAAALTFGLFVDDEVAAIQGVHVYSAVATRALRNADPNREMHLSGAVLAIVLGAAALSVAAYVGAAVRLARRVPPGPPFGRLPRALTGAGLASAGAFAAVGQGALSEADPVCQVLPLFEHVLGARPPAETFTLHYPPPGFAPPSMAARPDILVVAVESLRADAFTPTLMPALTRFRDSRACFRSARHFTNGHVTELGIFSLLYGLDAHHFLPFLRARTPSAALTTLRANGYRLEGISSSALRGWNGAELMVDQLDAYTELDDPAPAERDRRMVAAALARVPTSPSFRFLFFDSTHLDYDFPPEFEIDRPVMRPDFSNFVGGDRLAAHQDEVRNRYRNAVRWVDHLLGELLAAQGPNTWVAVVGDHGEEFWEEGLLGHSGPRFIRSRVEVPLVLCAPTGVDVAAAPPHDRTSHVDVLTTIFDAAGVEVPSNGHSLLQPQSAEPLVITGTGYPVDTGDFCLVGPDYKLWLVENASWRGQAFVRRVTDLDDRPRGPQDVGPPLATFNRRFREYLR